jgi:plastocyanin
MKTAKVAAIGAASIFAMVALLLAYPAAMAATQTAATTTSTSTTTSIIPTPTSLTPGQTITFTSTNGSWHVVKSSAKGDSVKSGPASGTETLTVTGAFKNGYALTVTSGTISINGTSYTFGSGSAEMGPYQAHLVGQGSFVSTNTSTTPGSFLFAGGAHANFEGHSYDTLRFDVQVNGQEYGVVLLVTSQVA